MQDPHEKLKQHQRFINNQRQQIKRLESRVQRLEALLEYSISDPQVRWLVTECEERMDATLPIYDPGRAGFHLDRYHFAASHVVGKKVADIACGTGYGTEILLHAGADSVIGIDIDAEAVAYASRQHDGRGRKSTAQSPGVLPVESQDPEPGIAHEDESSGQPHGTGIEFRCRPGQDTGIESESLDVVVSFETIEHVEDDQELLAEFKRILRPGGQLVISTPNQWPLEIAKFHRKEYDLQEFRRVLEDHFRILRICNQNSGTDFEFNRGQKRGIVETSGGNADLAECFLAIAEKV